MWEAHRTLNILDPFNFLWVWRFVSCVPTKRIWPRYSSKSLQVRPPQRRGVRLIESVADILLKRNRGLKTWLLSLGKYPRQFCCSLKKESVFHETCPLAHSLRLECAWWKLIEVHTCWQKETLICFLWIAKSRWTTQKVLSVLRKSSQSICYLKVLITIRRESQSGQCVVSTKLWSSFCPDSWWMR